MKRALLALALLAAVPAPVLAAACEPWRPQTLTLPTHAGWLTADGRVRVVGYNDMQGMLERLDALFTRAHPAIRFDLVLKGTRTGPPALIDGSSAFAPMGADMSEPDLAALRNATGFAPVRIAIAHDSLDPKALSGPLGVVVHPDNPLSRLGLDQAARLFSGGPHTWGELGLTGRWRDAPVHLVGLKPETAMGGEFHQRVLGVAAFSGSMTAFPQSRDVVAAVAADPLAIGFAGVNREGEVKVLALAPRRSVRAVGLTRENVHAGLYPLDRQLLIYAPRDRSGRLEPVTAEYLRLALSCEGQAAIAADPLGYIPLNAREARAERKALR